jgi:hypothetical protein
VAARRSYRSSRPEARLGRRTTRADISRGQPHPGGLPPGWGVWGDGSPHTGGGQGGRPPRGQRAGAPRGNSVRGFGPAAAGAYGDV